MSTNKTYKIGSILFTEKMFFFIRSETLRCNLTPTEWIRALIEAKMNQKIRFFDGTEFPAYNDMTEEERKNYLRKIGEIERKRIECSIELKKDTWDKMKQIKKEIKKDKKIGMNEINERFRNPV